MEKQMKCSHCGQIFTTIPDRNSFGEVCLCNTCLQQVPNLTITSTKLKSTHLSTKQLDEAILAIDQQLDKGHFSQDIKEGIHTYFDKYYKQRQSMDKQKEINLKLDQIIEKNTSNDSMTEEKFTELLEERNNDYNLDSMWHISFMGNKKNQEFKNDVLPKNSKKITNNSFWINGKFFSFILIATIISFTFYNFFTHPIKNHSIIELILCIIIGIIFLIPIFLVHEILHAIWFPKKAKKELWYEINRNSLFLFSFQIYSNCPLKRNRFLLMLLFPNIILALIPLFLWYCGIVFFSPFISRIIGSLLTILFTCGASDYSLFFDTILCTKKEDLNTHNQQVTI